MYIPSADLVLDVLLFGHLWKLLLVDQFGEKVVISCLSPSTEPSFCLRTDTFRCLTWYYGDIFRTPEESFFIIMLLQTLSV